MKVRITTEEIPEDQADREIGFNSKMILEVSGEQSLDAWANTFKQILHFLTWDEKAIKEIFVEE